MAERMSSEAGGNTDSTKSGRAVGGSQASVPAKQLQSSSGKPPSAHGGALANPILPSVLFSCSSIGMILLNKAVMRAYPHAGILLVLQTVATILLLFATSAQTRSFKPRMSVALKWIPIAALFCFNLFSSLQSMNFIGVATFSVLRYLQPLFSVPMDWVVRRAGELLHGWHALTFSNFAFAFVIVLSLSAMHTFLSLLPLFVESREMLTS